MNPVVETVSIRFVFLSKGYRLSLPKQYLPKIPYFEGRTAFNNDREWSFTINVDLPFFHQEAVVQLFRSFIDIKEHRKVDISKLNPSYLIELFYWADFFIIHEVIKNINQTPEIDDSNYQMLYIIGPDNIKFLAEIYIRNIWVAGFVRKMKRFINQNPYLSYYLWEIHTKDDPSFKEVLIGRLQVPNKRLSGIRKSETISQLSTYIERIGNPGGRIYNYEIPQDLKDRIDRKRAKIAEATNNPNAEEIIQEGDIISVIVLKRELQSLLIEANRRIIGKIKEDVEKNKYINERYDEDD